MSEFRNRVVIVTGGARGIGREIVAQFAARGARVAVIDRDDSDIVAGGRIEAHCGDVASAADVDAFVSGLAATYGRIDVLVNNAGILRDNMIWRMPEEDFDAVISVNLKGAWLMSKAVVPYMRRASYGRIVNIVSRAWLGNPGQSNYSASKGGLISLTRVLALELARSNVTVNAVAPGLIDTPMTRALSAEVYQKLVELQPGKRIGSCQDVAAAVCFFASDAASFITGQTLYVDGGRSVGASLG